MDPIHFMYRTQVIEPWATKINDEYDENGEEHPWKAVIVDNASCHVSEEVVRLCEQLRIKFLPLPSNSTWLTQPCDVALFKPFKEAWRVAVEVYNAARDKPALVLPKQDFTMVLELMVEELKRNHDLGSIIRSGFRVCGIYPLNRQLVLKRMYCFR